MALSSIHTGVSLFTYAKISSHIDKSINGDPATLAITKMKKIKQRRLHYFYLLNRVSTFGGGSKHETSTEFQNPLLSLSTSIG